MKYKAIIFDLDGTAIPNRPDGKPSQALINIVAKAKKTMIVTVATGRSSMSYYVLSMLKIASPCVISGGTQIIDPRTKKTLWEKKIPKTTIQKIIDICQPYPYEIIFSDEVKGEGMTAVNRKVVSDERVLYIMDVKKNDAAELLKNLKKINQIASQEVVSWTKRRLDIHVTHKQATKEHSIKELLKILKVKPGEVIGVGDANNDLPLLHSVGLKIAMGNAEPKLKKIADYIAPSVENDGLVWVIKKFCLG